MGLVLGKRRFEDPTWKYTGGPSVKQLRIIMKFISLTSFILLLAATSALPTTGPATRDLGPKKNLPLGYKRDVQLESAAAAVNTIPPEDDPDVVDGTLIATYGCP
ncbi:hypothetical protein ASPZODRAFT_20189 [Penicilliopsis zonata CBS 506.65]|uniref:Uncharacterized protein n=1 Tax=Penicilliopsis zonata CBS 506.65 TaxID=1073090 RepID=A0A1L9S676_9EURO|nr:hypothetical protein ASPZODRAFT_20189 [Penicilliopsis zonata CBS 506.65]OJJ42662.1 hypothetical protein ASPZODRAFT_20189 [Penicilliopsis zonata CBS 506.65]